jgi:peptide deformylase
MAVIEVVKYPAPILRQKAKPLTSLTEAENILIKDMIETMYFNNGVGLAATQVGIDRRIIVLNDTQKKGDELVIINPKIVHVGGRVVGQEGCLSIPGVSRELRRANALMIEGLNMEGKEIRLNVKGLTARIIQHEIDHLDGILFVDRLPFFQRRKVLAELKKRCG